MKYMQRISAAARHLSSVALIASLSWGLFPAPVRAQQNEPPSAPSSEGPASVAQLNEAGLQLYAVGDYRRALEKFIQAHAKSQDPNLLFNIARCYEELGEADAALEKYELFVRSPGADPEGLERARQAMSALATAESSNIAVVGAEPLPAAPADAGVAEPAPALQLPEWLPWATLGGSVAFAVAGVTFYALGASDHDRVTSLPQYGDGRSVANLTRREADDLVSSGDTKKLVGGVSFGIAGALAAATAVLLVTRGTWSGPEQAPELELRAQATHDGGGLLVRGMF